MSQTFLNGNIAKTSVFISYSSCHFFSTQVQGVHCYFESSKVSQIQVSGLNTFSLSRGRGFTPVTHQIRKMIDPFITALLV